MSSLVPCLDRQGALLYGRAQVLERGSRHMELDTVDTIRVDADASVITFDALPDELKERFLPYV